MNGSQYDHAKDMPRMSLNGKNENNANGNMEIPFFERQESDDFMALQDARHIIDVLHHRVRSLENINIDLEYRLEQQAKQTMQAEHEYTEIDRMWKGKYAEMQKEAEEWAKKFQAQTLKTEKLRDHLNRTERELYGMLQRKYQLMRGGMPQTTASDANKGTVNHQAPAGVNENNIQVGVSSVHTTPPHPSQPHHQHNNAPLSSSGGTESLREVYHNLPPELRERRFLVDMGDFLGV